MQINYRFKWCPRTIGSGPKTWASLHHVPDCQRRNLSICLRGSTNMLQPAARMKKWTVSPLPSVADAAIQSQCLSWDNFGCLEDCPKKGCYLYVPLSPPFFCHKWAYFWFPSETLLLRLKLEVITTVPHLLVLIDWYGPTFTAEHHSLCHVFLSCFCYGLLGWGAWSCPFRVARINPKSFPGQERTCLSPG